MEYLGADTRTDPRPSLRTGPPLVELAELNDELVHNHPPDRPAYRRALATSDAVRFFITGGPLPLDFNYGLTPFIIRLIRLKQLILCRA